MIKKFFIEKLISGFGSKLFVFIPKINFIPARVVI
jgi:hypothetical protein